jgi:antitoxin ParD1/3/4
MAQMNISLPDALKDWVEAQVATGRYATASDYMRALVRHHQENEEKLIRLRDLVQKGLDSGVSDATMDSIREEVIAARANA